MSNEKYVTNRPRDEKSRQYVAVLYEDDPSHVQALDEIQRLPGAEWWYIRHYLDVKDDGTGELKKPHWHVVLRLKNPRHPDSLAASLGLAPNYLQVANKVSGAIRYLVHKDDSDKFQYPVSAVCTNASDVLRRALSDSLDDSTSARMILQFVQAQVACLSMSTLAFWCFENGCYAAFRRAYGMFRDVVREHNMMVKGDDLFG